MYKCSIRNIFNRQNVPTPFGVGTFWPAPWKWDWMESGSVLVNAAELSVVDCNSHIVAHRDALQIIEERPIHALLDREGSVFLEGYLHLRISGSLVAKEDGGNNVRDMGIRKSKYHSIPFRSMTMPSNNNAWFSRGISDEL